jgi:hypothetical protein
MESRFGALAGPKSRGRPAVNKSTIIRTTNALPSRSIRESAVKVSQHFCLVPRQAHKRRNLFENIAELHTCFAARRGPHGASRCPPSGRSCAYESHVPITSADVKPREEAERPAQRLAHHRIARRLFRPRRLTAGFLQGATPGFTSKVASSGRGNACMR